MLYYAANVVFKTTDGGNSWQTISPDLTREHPGIPASLGSLVRQGRRQAARRHLCAGAVVQDPEYALGRDRRRPDLDHAATAERIGQTSRPRNSTPWSKVTQLAASHFDDETAYASVSRFRINDLHPYIYRTHDGGKNWKLITAGLPEFAPVDTVREDPVRKGLLFAGTENACGFRSMMATTGNRCN